MFTRARTIVVDARPYMKFKTFYLSLYLNMEREGGRRQKPLNKTDPNHILTTTTPTQSTYVGQPKTQFYPNNHNFVN